MANEEGPAVTSREELDRVLASGCFARSVGLSRLLRFLVERELEGRGSELKESLIGIAVYGRTADYDPKLDSTVRSEMARLRARLHKYYSTEGSRDLLVIELPKGSYVPRFQPAESSRPSEATPASRRWLAALASLGIAAATITGWWLEHRPRQIAIAVLPLANFSKEGATDYLADGLTTEIISEISLIEGLTVRSQTSSFALKGKSGSVHDAGKLLAADYILEGSL